MHKVYDIHIYDLGKKKRMVRDPLTNASDRAGPHSKQLSAVIFCTGAPASRWRCRRNYRFESSILQKEIKLREKITNVLFKSDYRA